MHEGVPKVPRNHLGRLDTLNETWRCSLGWVYVGRGDVVDARGYEFHKAVDELGLKLDINRATV